MFGETSHLSHESDRVSESHHESTAIDLQLLPYTTAALFICEEYRCAASFPWPRIDSGALCVSSSVLLMIPKPTDINRKETC